MNLPGVDELLALVHEVERLGKEHMKAAQAPRIEDQLLKYGVHVDGRLNTG